MIPPLTIGRWGFFIKNRKKYSKNTEIFRIFATFKKSNGRG